MKLIKRTLFHLFWLLIALTAAGLLAVAAAAIYFVPSLPDVNSLQNYQLATPLRVYSQDGKLIGEYGEQRRQIVDFDEVPADLVNAIVAAEDQDFFSHPGIDPRGLARAAMELAASGSIRSGGSTITMQVARNYLLTLDQTFTRKIREILLALQMERILTKEQIFELYVNKIYLGQGAYGVGSAAQIYFNKPLSQLTLPEAATIAGLPKAPSNLNPIANPERSLIRRNWILLRMQQLGYVDNEQYQQAVQAPIQIQRSRTELQLQAQYVAEMARQYAISRFGDRAYTDGYSITTTLDSRTQNQARDALIDGLVAYDARHGWRGPEQSGIPSTLAEAQERTDRRGLEEELAASPEVAQTARQAAERSSTRVEGIEEDVSNWLRVLGSTPNVGPLEPAIVIDVQGQQMRVLRRNGQVETIGWDELRWAAPYRSVRARGASPTQAAQIAARGDLVRVVANGQGNSERWRLSQTPQIEGAIVVLDPRTGAIRALQGGFSFAKSSFNRATQARRQPGSSFKPFIYLSALEQGNMTPATVINDAPIVQQELSGDVWRPENDTRSFLGPTRLREGLYRSRNLVTIRALQATGLDNTLDMLERMGFNRAQLPNGLSLALGSASLTPLEIARGYAEIANGGFKVLPWYIARITQGEDQTNLLDEPNPPAACPECDPFDSTVEIDGRTYPIAERVADGASVYMLQDMMRDVIRRGTGRAALSIGRDDLAGKTGTSNDQRDTWFSGFNSALVATVWVGMDDNSSTGEYGAQAALPIWTQFMGQALEGMSPQFLPRPENVVSARIDPQSGRRLRDNDPGGISEIFRADNLPPYQEPSVRPDLENESGSQGTGSYDAIF